MAYWVNGLLGAVVLAIVSAPLYLFPDLHPIAVLGGLVLISSFSSLFTIWWSVGVWRSAAAYAASDRPLVWALLAWLMVVLNVLGAIYGLAWRDFPAIEDQIEIVRGDPDNNTRQLRLVRNGTELVFDGGISFGAANEVRQILDAAPDVRVIHLRSPGGRVSAAVELKNLITERNLATHVSTECASACTIAFAGGRVRTIGKNAHLGFHRPYGAGTSEAEIDLLVLDLKRILVADGVSRAFLDRAYSVPSDTIWYPTVEELLSARYALMKDQGVVAMSELRDAMSREDMEAFLLAKPVYVAIKTADLSAFNAAVGMWAKARDEGASRREVTSNSHRMIRHLVRMYLPFADDESVLALGELIADQMTLLKKKTAVGCYNVAANGWSSLAPDVALLSDDLMAREEQVAARIIAQGKFGASYPNIDPTATQHAVAAVQTRLKRRIPEAETVLNGLRSPLADREMACRTMEALLREALNGPAAEGALVLRQLVSPR